MIWIFISIIVVLILVFIYINARLFVYIKKLEERIKEAVDKNDRLYQSLKDLVQEGFLLNDGRLKKFVYQKERNKIFNGVKVEDNDSEL